MGYKKAEEILPEELIQLIQQYVDGQTIYIPRKAEHRLEWGATTQTRAELHQRNQQIFRAYEDGASAAELAEQYFLTEKSILRIIKQMKEQES
ncbi:MAG: hypothetical protein IJ315_08320 [Firmicutes bacterium]|nr:hypothetical protein [Bacillota bacterium]